MTCSYAMKNLFVHKRSACESELQKHVAGNDRSCATEKPAKDESDSYSSLLGPTGGDSKCMISNGAIRDKTIIDNSLKKEKVKKTHACNGIYRAHP